MATKTADLHVRLQPSLKAQAEEIFADSGYTASEAIEQMYRWTVSHSRMPKIIRRRHISVPVLDDMTEAEIKEMVAEARQQVRDGKTSSPEEIKDFMRTEYGAKI